jgi:uncharacterized membrane protein
MSIHQLIADAAVWIEALGVLIIVVGIIICIFKFFINIKRQPFNKTYIDIRTFLGKTLLLGLEVLVAADIVRSVTGSPDLDSILVLGLIILIRTFLSFSLSIEMEGKLPWRKSNA